jgi:hypothetical protein
MTEIKLYAKRGDCYFPLVTLDLAKLRDKGFDDQFMLEYFGQISKLYVAPPGTTDSTPHVEIPLQPLNETTGGKPDLTIRTEVEKVTVFFATGHSKV